MFYIYQGNRIKYKGDPLQDFTLMKFLERFVFKNPKKADQGKSKISLSTHESNMTGYQSQCIILCHENIKNVIVSVLRIFCAEITKINTTKRIKTKVCFLHV